MADDYRDGTSAGADRDKASLALYRRYRPDTFDEVIGQEHVTEPLKRALANNKVAHAYLFSGPRGCGKTTSARIMARCLNCEQGPTPTPCGECDSCRSLATGGPGSIDVIELDAASHGGVDDARDLRERAFFAPVSSRYKIYIVDEAHMVTPQGFNALLKIVEEPPPHVKFIFATTEPDKVIGTIRSRTHHYPFRLVPPTTLAAYLESICRDEGIEVEAAALPLVVRAGAGSVRDSLSVLDQLLGSADEGRVTYRQAAALLGYTPDSLLDEVVDSFAAHDAPGVFGCIDKVTRVGQDPRRFAEDLLHRLRDLVIVASVPDAVSSGLIDVAPDQAERLRTQAAGLGSAELTRAAGIIATGLTDMRGTTTPRLHLELMCSRILIPGADVSEVGLTARVERLERRLAMAASAQPVPAPPIQPDATTQPAGQARLDGPAARPEPASRREPDAARGHVPATQRPAGQPPAGQRPAGQAPGGWSPEATLPPDAARHPQPTRPTAAAASVPAGTQLTLADLRREWPQVLERVKSMRRFTWMVLNQNTQVAGLDDGVLTLAFTSSGALATFESRGNSDTLREALIATLGLDVHIQLTDAHHVTQPGNEPPHRAPAAAPRHADVPRDDGNHHNTHEGAALDDSARDAVGPRSGVHVTTPEADDEPNPNDVILDEPNETVVELLKRELGARPIDE